MTRKKKWMIAVGVVVVLAAVAVANLTIKREAGVAVTVEAIKKRDLESVVSASGKIQPKRQVNISADTMGRVTNLAVEEGDRVKKDQFLLQIDPRNLRTRVESSEAGLLASRSGLEQARQAVETAKVNLTLSRENLRRQRELWQGQLTTREALDRSENEVKVRESDVREREQQVKTTELRINQERSTVESARYDLSKVRIESPIDGLVTRRNIEEGETVVVGTMNNAGTVLLTIADMSVLEAEVEVDETDIPFVKIGQTAKITVDAVPDKTFTGRVTEIGNSPIQAAAGQARQATNFKVVVTLDGEIPEVRPGFTCSASITTATRTQAVAVPIQATAVRELTFDASGNLVRPPADAKGKRPKVQPKVDDADLPPGQTRKETEGVFLVRDNKVEFTPIKTGIAGDKYFEVVSGIKDGDQVVTGPFASVRELRDGATVKIDNAATTPSSSAGSSPVRVKSQ